MTPSTGRVVTGAWLLLVVPPLVWAGNIVIGRAVGETFPPVSLTIARSMVALLALAPFVAGRAIAQAALLRRNAWLILVCGATGIAGYSALAYVALRTIPAAEVAFLNSALPLMVPLLAYFMTGERIGARQWAGILISFAGVAWIVSRGQPVAFVSDIQGSWGELVTLFAVANYAFYSVLLRRRSPELDQLVFLAATIAAAVLVLLPFWAMELMAGATIPHDAGALAVVLYTGLVSTILGYGVWNLSVSTFGSAVTGISYHLLSVFTPLLAFLVLGERLEPFHVVGIVLILAGFFLATLGLRAAAPPAT